MNGTSNTSDQALADLRARLADPNRDAQPSGADPRKPALRSVRADDGLLAMLRHAAEHYGMHHIAAIAEIRVLNRPGTSDAEFRAKTIEILDALRQVDDELDEVTEAVTR